MTDNVLADSVLHAANTEKHTVAYELSDEGKSGPLETFLVPPLEGSMMLSEHLKP